jgi:Chaperone for flagella basal body P-ring formation
MKKIGFLIALLAAGFSAKAQVSTCDASGKQAVARRWDVVLGHEWEMVRDCRHPEWPVRAQLVKSEAASVAVKPVASVVMVASQEPIVVHAGDVVTLWQQAAFVRIEMSGVAERAARSGERIDVRVTHTTAEGGLSVERFSGTVRAPGNVEMEQ